MAGQPWSWAGVGAAKELANHPRTGAENSWSGPDMARNLGGGGAPGGAGGEPVPDALGGREDPPGDVGVGEVVEELDGDIGVGGGGHRPLHEVVGRRAQS